ncbi:aldo/keto reductase [Rhizobium johnstonii]|uniref:aldo/keto reductase n=1 Tax=Rhizobium johnstonii TaxID=3019933 RepID=UPI003F97AA62
MITTRKLGRSDMSAPPIGMGCWAIGGHFTMDGMNDGWGDIDDAQSIRAIHVGLELGATLFDTSDAYGTGHSEEVIGEALKGRREQAIIATKFGYTYDRDRRALIGSDVSKTYIEWAWTQSARRLGTDCIDLFQIHVGELTDQQADEAGETLEKLADQGRIRAWGWSTGNVVSARRMLKFPNFVSIQQSLNVLNDAPDHIALCETGELASLNNSPLAMGLLSGKFGSGSQLPKSDVRAAGHSWVRDFVDGKPRPEVLRKIGAIRDLLQTGGRTTAQGALGWLLARSENTFPIPGFKTEAQVRDNLGALQLGALPPPVMQEIDGVLAELG